MNNRLNYSTWQEKSIVLLQVQKDKSYKSNGYNTYTQWLNSHVGKGCSRSNLIAIKTAGEFYLQLINSDNLQDILKCKVQDFKLIGLLKKNYHKINLDNIILKIDKGQLKRSDIEPISSHQLLKQIRVFFKDNTQAIKLINQLEIIEKGMYGK